jgi:hypothetical protein
MSIAELLKQPVGITIKEKGAGFPLVAKTIKKNWFDPDGKKIQQVVFNDSTGDLLGDIVMKKGVYGYGHIQRGWTIRIIERALQQTPEGLKLYVTEYEPPPSASEPDDYGIDPDLLAFQQREIEGKCRYGISCSLLRAGKNIGEVLALKSKINELVEFIREGK